MIQQTLWQWLLASLMCMEDGVHLGSVQMLFWTGEWWDGWNEGDCTKSFFSPRRWGVTNYRVACRWEGVRVTALTRWLMSECEGNFSHVQLVFLLLAPEMLTMLDLPTFMESPRYEVQTRPHTAWSGSPIRFVGLVSIILNICLKSFLLE